MIRKNKITQSLKKRTRYANNQAKKQNKQTKIPIPIFLCVLHFYIYATVALKLYTTESTMLHQYLTQSIF